MPHLRQRQIQIASMRLAGSMSATCLFCKKDFPTACMSYILLMVVFVWMAFNSIAEFLGVDPSSTRRSPKATAQVFDQASLQALKGACIGQCQWPIGTHMAFAMCLQLLTKSQNL